MTCGAAASGLAGHMPVTLRIGALRGVSAASASGSGGLSAGQWTAVIGVAAVLFAGYLIGCSIWPYGPCLSCIAHRGQEPGQQLAALGPVQALQGIRRADPLGLPAPAEHQARLMASADPAATSLLTGSGRAGIAR